MKSRTTVYKRNINLLYWWGEGAVTIRFSDNFIKPKQAKLQNIKNVKSQTF